VRTFGTVRIIVIPLITEVHDGFSKPAFGTLNVVRDLRQVMELEWGAVFVNQAHEVNAVKKQAVFAQEKFILRKIKSLLDKVYVFCSHASDSKKCLYGRDLRKFRFEAKICAKILQFEWMSSNLK
jgi:hypothetical protein